MTPVISQIPTGPVAVPTTVARLAGDDAVVPVWLNELGGRTFRLSGPDDDRFVKWVPADVADLDLDTERVRLAWAGAHTRVPRVLDAGADAEGRWLVTAALPGRSAVDPYWVARPEAAARAIGAGLRALHDALPVDDCPFSWGVADRVAPLGPAARARVGEVPPDDRIVVCHGDPCAPNTLVDDDGRWVAHVDLDALGVADRWADLAVGSYSLAWNYGDGYEPAFFEAYGVDPTTEANARRIEFYRRLWDLG